MAARSSSTEAFGDVCGIVVLGGVMIGPLCREDLYREVRSAGRGDDFRGRSPDCQGKPHRSEPRRLRRAFPGAVTSTPAQIVRPAPPCYQRRAERLQYQMEL
jgi:hypothetical protein